MNTQDITLLLKLNAEKATSDMLHDLIKDHGLEAGRRRRLYDRYEQERAAIPIMTKEPANYEKVFEKMPNDFFGDIIDRKVGYMGNEVMTALNKEEYGAGEDFQQKKYDDHMRFLRLFQKGEYTLDNNAELILESAVTGVAYRLLWVGKDGAAHIKNLPSWETVLYMDAAGLRPEYAMRYYQVTDRVNNESVSRYVVEWYDSQLLTIYMENDEQNFRIWEAGGGQKKHFFNGVPVIEFDNNKGKRGEADKVLELIDAYDSLLSSTTSELEQLRLAYMFAKGSGLTVDDEFYARLEQTGIFPLPEDGEAGFLNKVVSAEAVQYVLEEIRRNIYLFAKSIDLSKDLGGEMRVIGWQVSLLNLENSCKVTERKFIKGFTEQYGLLTSHWSATSKIKIDATALEYTFTRNFPKDLAGEAETLGKLLGNVSRATAYGLMSFIDDPEAEEQAFLDEQTKSIDNYDLLDNAEDDTEDSQFSVVE